MFPLAYYASKSFLRSTCSSSESEVRKASKSNCGFSIIILMLTHDIPETVVSSVKTTSAASLSARFPNSNVSSAAKYPLSDVPFVVEDEFYNT